MEINPKYDIGQVVWRDRLVSIFHTCEICEGEGKIQYRGYELRCPECQGTGKKHRCGEKEYVVDEVVITSIKATISSDCMVRIRYKVKPTERNNTSRSEGSLFATKEEALAWCEARTRKMRGDENGD